MSDVGPIPVKTSTFHGRYLYQKNGRDFQYYGKYVSGPGSNWEARVFKGDKKFRYDGIFNSPDILATWSGPLVDVAEGELLRKLAIHAVESKIEEWAEYAEPEAD